MARSSSDQNRKRKTTSSRSGVSRSRSASGRAASSAVKTMRPGAPNGGRKRPTCSPASCWQAWACFASPWCWCRARTSGRRCAAVLRHLWYSDLPGRAVPALSGVSAGVRVPRIAVRRESDADGCPLRRCAVVFSKVSVSGASPWKLSKCSICAARPVSGRAACWGRRGGHAARPVWPAGFQLYHAVGFCAGVDGLFCHHTGGRGPVSGRAVPQIQRSPRGTGSFCCSLRHPAVWRRAGGRTAGEPDRHAA